MSDEPAQGPVTTEAPAGLALPTPDLIAALSAIVGSEHALMAPADQARYLTEWRGRYVGRTPLVVRPGSTGEVARILAACHAARVGVVPQGGNTGLVGGQIPRETGGEIVLSLERLRAIRAVDSLARHLTVEAGLTVAEVRAHANSLDRQFCVSLASEGTCQIGGILATNAGGLDVLAHGSARDQVLGLEVVLADGRIWPGLRSLKKDNTGYDLKHLFVGSEGTLGIITAATLKLRAKPEETATAFLALADLEAARAVFDAVEETAGPMLTAFELMSAFAVDVVARHVPGARRPFASPARQPWYVLMELSGSPAHRPAHLVRDEIVAACAEAGAIADAVLPASQAQTRALWALREAMSEAQKHEGGSIKHDISVAPEHIPELIRRADAVAARICPGARPCAFGHFGDGNIHYNVSQPVGMDNAAFLALWDTMSAAVHDVVAELGGSISAEHGIGRMKRGELARLKNPVELALMRSLKAALDPRGILNPGKVV
ncbi:MAG: FAD-binding oxidoreductase [Hyphomicrobiaceae bacterium]|nr:FAD-binding oxidoreductase [Hyphomicrobiaceae bacterium]